MATTRSNTLGRGSVSSWMRMLRLSTILAPAFGRIVSAKTGGPPTGGGPPRELPLFRRERVLRCVLLGENFFNLRLVLHGPLDGKLGGVVVVLVNLAVVLGLPVDEHAADDHEVIDLVLGNDAVGDAVGDGL